MSALPWTIRGAELLSMLCLLLIAASITAAPFPSSQHTQMEPYYTDTSGGCYYNFQHYDEGDRILTNEPCLNCTCHNRMLMCYLRVCPFTKAIGQDCKVEKKSDQCCPVITCPEVPVQLLTSTTTEPFEQSTEVGHLDNYGCSIDEVFYSDGAQVPSNPHKPCELCYCIRNRTACVMQECTLHVQGCKPVYQEGVCCPVRYACDYPEDNITTTTITTPGLLITTTAPPGTFLECIYNNEVFADGALIRTTEPCEHCYCMKGEVICAVQECGMTLEKAGKNCTALPPREGQCCPDSYECEEIDTTVTEAYATTTPITRVPEVTITDTPKETEREPTEEDEKMHVVTSTTESLLKLTESSISEDQTEGIIIPEHKPVDNEISPSQETTIQQTHDEVTEASHTETANEQKTEYPEISSTKDHEHVSEITTESKDTSHTPSVDESSKTYETHVTQETTTTKAKEVETTPHVTEATQTHPGSSSLSPVTDHVPKREDDLPEDIIIEYPSDLPPRFKPDDDTEKTDDITPTTTYAEPDTTRHPTTLSTKLEEGTQKTVNEYPEVDHELTTETIDKQDDSQQTTERKEIDRFTTEPVLGHSEDATTEGVKETPETTENFTEGVKSSTEETSEISKEEDTQHTKTTEKTYVTETDHKTPELPESTTAHTEESPDIQITEKLTTKKTELSGADLTSPVSVTTEGYHVTRDYEETTPEDKVTHARLSTKGHEHVTTPIYTIEHDIMTDATHPEPEMPPSDDHKVDHAGRFPSDVLDDSVQDEKIQETERDESTTVHAKPIDQTGGPLPHEILTHQPTVKPVTSEEDAQRHTTTKAPEDKVTEQSTTDSSIHKDHSGAEQTTEHVTKIEHVTEKEKQEPSTTMTSPPAQTDKGIDTESPVTTVTVSEEERTEGTKHTETITEATTKVTQSNIETTRPDKNRKDETTAEEEKSPVTEQVPYTTIRVDSTYFTDKETDENEISHKPEEASTEKKTEDVTPPIQTAETPTEASRATETVPVTESVPSDKPTLATEPSKEITETHTEKQGVAESTTTLPLDDANITTAVTEITYNETSEVTKDDVATTLKLAHKPPLQEFTESIKSTEGDETQKTEKVPSQETATESVKPTEQVATQVTEKPTIEETTENVKVTQHEETLPQETTESVRPTEEQKTDKTISQEPTTERATSIEHEGTKKASSQETTEGMKPTEEDQTNKTDKPKSHESVTESVTTTEHGEAQTTEKPSLHETTESAKSSTEHVESQETEKPRESVKPTEDSNTSTPESSTVQEVTTASEDKQPITEEVSTKTSQATQETTTQVSESQTLKSTDENVTEVDRHTAVTEQITERTDEHVSMDITTVSSQTETEANDITELPDRFKEPDTTTASEMTEKSDDKTTTVSTEEHSNSPTTQATEHQTKVTTSVPTELTVTSQTESDESGAPLFDDSSVPQEVEEPSTTKSSQEHTKTQTDTPAAQAEQTQTISSELSEHVTGSISSTEVPHEETEGTKTTPETHTVRTEEESTKTQTTTPEVEIKPSTPSVTEGPKETEEEKLEKASPSTEHRYISSTESGISKPEIHKTTVEAEIRKEDFSTPKETITTSKPAEDTESEDPISEEHTTQSIRQEVTTFGYKPKKDEEITTDSEKYIPLLPATSPPSHETETPFTDDDRYIPQGVPGEGNCLVEGQTYENNSAVPSLNPCQTSCKCISSIVHCDSVKCSPPPAHMQNCMPIYQSPHSCCPTYACTGEKPTTDMESHSQVSEGHKPETTTLLFEDQKTTESTKVAETTDSEQVTTVRSQQSTSSSVEHEITFEPEHTKQATEVTKGSETETSTPQPTKITTEIHEEYHKTSKPTEVEQQTVMEHVTEETVKEAQTTKVPALETEGTKSEVTEKQAAPTTEKGMKEETSGVEPQPTVTDQGGHEKTTQMSSIEFSTKPSKDTLPTDADIQKPEDHTEVSSVTHEEPMSTVAPKSEKTERVPIEGVTEKTHVETSSTKPEMSTEHMETIAHTVATPADRIFDFDNKVEETTSMPREDKTEITEKYVPSEHVPTEEITKPSTEENETSPGEHVTTEQEAHTEESTKHVSESSGHTTELSATERVTEAQTTPSEETKPVPESTTGPPENYTETSSQQQTERPEQTAEPATEGPKSPESTVTEETEKPLENIPVVTKEVTDKPVEHSTETAVQMTEQPIELIPTEGSTETSENATTESTKYDFTEQQQTQSTTTEETVKQSTEAVTGKESVTKQTEDKTEKTVTDPNESQNEITEGKEQHSTTLSHGTDAPTVEKTETPMEKQPESDESTKQPEPIKSITENPEVTTEPITEETVKPVSTEKTGEDKTTERESEQPTVTTESGNETERPKHEKPAEKQTESPFIEVPIRTEIVTDKPEHHVTEVMKEPNKQDEVSTTKTSTETSATTIKSTVEQVTTEITAEEHPTHEEKTKTSPVAESTEKAPTIAPELSITEEYTITIGGGPEIHTEQSSVPSETESPKAATTESPEEKPTTEHIVQVPVQTEANAQAVTVDTLTTKAEESTEVETEGPKTEQAITRFGGEDTEKPSSATDIKHDTTLIPEEAPESIQTTKEPSTEQEKQTTQHHDTEEHIKHTTEHVEVSTSAHTESDQNEIIQEHIVTHTEPQDEIREHETEKNEDYTTKKSIVSTEGYLEPHVTTLTPEITPATVVPDFPHTTKGSLHTTTYDYTKLTESFTMKPPTTLQPDEHMPEIPDYTTTDDYEEEQNSFGPGMCRYGGKVYVSAQQIPRDDPCDFCFCFRSDIICLQQSCPPPIQGCHEEPIHGFCCPRYECPVPMANVMNMTTTTTTTTTTLPPHFLSHAYKGQVQKRGCQIQGSTYQVGELVKSASGPCMQCRCGGDGQMKCEPKVCSPQPMLQQMIEAASRRRR